MPDFAELDQRVGLAKALWFLPPPARPKFAQAMFDLGVRIHPELATTNLLVGGAPGLGAHRPRRPVKVESRRDAENIIRSYLPELADRLGAASTEAQKQQLLTEIREQFPAIIAQAEQRLAAANPEDFEK